MNVTLLLLSLVPAPTPIAADVSAETMRPVLAPPALPIAPRQDRDELPLLRVGEAVEGVIDDDAPAVETDALAAGFADAPTVARTFRIEVDEPGPYTLELRSYFFDTYLVLRDGDGAPLAEDDDGLIGTHSRLVVPNLETGASYRVDACALHGQRGPFELVVKRGVPPPESASEQAALELDDARRRIDAVEAAAGADSLELAAAMDGLMVLHFRRGEYAETRDLVERSLAIREAALGPDHLDVARTLNNLAATLHELGDFAATRPVHERALAIRESALGPDHPEVAQSLGALALVQVELGEYAAARPLFERALAIVEAAYGPDHPSVVARLTGLGRLLSDAGDPASARPILERAVRIAEATLGPSHPRFSESLALLSVVLYELGDYAAARQLAERVLAIQEQTLGPRHPSVGQSLANLAALLAGIGDYAAARPLLERSLAIIEAALGPMHPEVAIHLGNLGEVLTILGDLSVAQPLFERAVTITEAALGPDHPAVADRLDNLAKLHYELGDYATARRLWERTLAIREQALGPDHPAIAAAVGNLSALLYELGDFGAARPLVERALALRERTLGPDHPDVALTLGNLGLLITDLGDPTAARPLIERAIAIQESALGPDHPDVATSLDHLARACLELGDHTAARSLWERALAIRERAFGPEHPEVAQSLDRLCVVLHAMGEPAAARASGERALAIRLAALGSGHPEVAMNVLNVTLICLTAGDASAAWDHARRLVEHRGQLLRTLASMTSGESHLYLAKLHQQLHALLAAAAAVGDHAAAHDAVLDAKGRVARLTLQTRRQIRDDLEGETLATVERLSRIQSRLSRLALSTDVADRAAHDALLESLRAERDELDRELRRRAAVGERAAVGTRDVAAALPARSAVVDLLVHPAWERSEPEEGADLATVEWSAPRVSAWVVRADDVGVRHVDLGPAGPIESATATFLEELVARRGVAMQTEGADEDGNALLRALVWDPLAPHLDDVDTVFLSPDGVLGTLPYETLRDEDGRFLVERYAFVYPTEVASMVEWPSRVDPLGDGDASLLAVGGVDFRRRAALPAPVDGSGGTPSPRLLASARGASADGRTTDSSDARDTNATPSDDLRGSFASYWGRLPATEYESQVVTDMHEDALLDDASRLLLQGPDATEERLKREMPRHAILHLATHGFFQPEGLPSMWEQALDAVNGERGAGMRMTETAQRLTGLHPGLLSGLVLAGANRPPDDGVVSGGVARSAAAAAAETEAETESESESESESETESESEAESEAETEAETETETETETDPAAPLRDDGYLTASEVTLLDLSAVDLVVLSACETGLGRPQSGEGLLGLRRAFHMAGADTVISSLWSVKDESTSELMQSFYANLFFKGMGRHEALRAAQLEMLQRNRMEHGNALPSTWGAFVLSGEWR